LQLLAIIAGINFHPVTNSHLHPTDFAHEIRIWWMLILAGSVTSLEKLQKFWNAASERQTDREWEKTLHYISYTTSQRHCNLQYWQWQDYSIAVCKTDRTKQIKVAL